jgi:predicted acylesterase/phospholipase RssA
MTAKRPEKICDLVMKGGVTSGVVYPRAISELSKQYRFSNIGGTSAGAIAASVAAAAEYARGRGNLGAFADLNDLPDWLGGASRDGKHSNLYHLFQPQKPLKGLYTVAISALGKSRARAPFAILSSALRAFPIAALLGIAPGMITAWMACEISPGLARWLGLLMAILTGSLGLVAGLTFGAGRELRKIPTAAWGICSGMTEGPSEYPALVPWLADYLDRIAVKDRGEPLTFGDLRSQEINLNMIATNVTTGRPYSLPLGEHSHFFFKGNELRRFFPEYVVRWMEEHPGRRSTRDSEGQVDSAGLSVLPDAKDLPVIVAVRMSLSFPFLFCPIPLYGVDFGFGPKTPDRKKSVPEPSYFVDGGLTSNFPLNLFDKPLPRWPTFGINLRNTNDGRHNQEIYIACKNSGGLEEWWTRFDEKRAFRGLLSYFGLLFDTSREWRDNLQLQVPGYRDRVVHIGLNPSEEGGMNFDMDANVIALLTQRGESAGAAILSRYSPTDEHPSDPNCEVGLDNQKWVRFRSFMWMLEEALLSVNEAAGYSGFGELSYDQLLLDGMEPSYKMPPAQRQYAIKLLTALKGLVPEIDEKRVMGQSFETRVPKPEPDLKVTPHF